MRTPGCGCPAQCPPVSVPRAWSSPGACAPRPAAAAAAANATARPRPRIPVAGAGALGRGGRGGDCRRARARGRSRRARRGGRAAHRRAEPAAQQHRGRAERCGVAGRGPGRRCVVVAPPRARFCARVPTQSQRVPAGLTSAAPISPAPARRAPTPLLRSGAAGGAGVPAFKAAAAAALREYFDSADAEEVAARCALGTTDFMSCACARACMRMHVRACACT